MCDNNKLTFSQYLIIYDFFVFMSSNEWFFQLFNYAFNKLLFKLILKESFVKS